MERAYRLSTRFLSALLVLIGLVMMAAALARGGGALALGVVLGAMLAALGGARLWLALRPPAGGGQR